MTYRKRGQLLFVLSVLSMSGMVPTARAAEQASQAPASAASAAVIHSIEGTVASLELTSAAPSLHLTTADGQSRSLLVDPKALTVWRSGQYVLVSQLKAGNRVVIKYMQKDGTNVVQSIRVQEPTVPASVPAAH